MLLASAGAHAQDEAPVTAAIEWHREAGAEECMDATAIRREVDRRLGRRAVAPRERADLVVDGTLSAGADGFRARLVLQRPDGRALGVRELSTKADHCSALDESLALVVALMVDVPRSEIPPAPATPPPVARPRGVVIPAETFAPRRPWHFGASALGAFTLGLEPKGVFGARALLWLEPPAFARFEVEASTYASARADAERSGAGTDFRASTLGLFVCPLAFGGARLCAGQVVAQVDAEGFGFDQSYQQARLAAAVGVRARYQVSLLGPLVLSAGLGADGYVFRDRFFYTRSDGVEAELFRASPVVGSAELGFGLSFPSEP